MKLKSVATLAGIAILSLSIDCTARAASIVKVIYSHNGRHIATGIYTGPDGGSSSNPADYWKLAGGPPEIAGQTTIQPDKPDGLTATIAGKVKVALMIRNRINMGIIELNSPKFVRANAKSDVWSLSSTDFRAITDVINKRLKNTLTVTYRQKYATVTQSIYVVPDEGQSSKSIHYWNLLGKTPDVVSSANIRPDQPNGKTATLKGEISIRLTPRPHFDIGGNTGNNGIIETNSLQLVRDDSSSGGWHLSKEEQDRIVALLTK